jgi:tetratricopeptide (TPR) repeat protein
MNKIETKYCIAICLILAIITFIVYTPVLRSNFISFDDGDYVYENNHITIGPTPQNILWAFTNTHADNYHPLTSMSLMLDSVLYGSKHAGFHLTNLLFHIANTILLFLVLGRLTGRLWPSAFVAALFALHPLHVESVAWVSERKDVLSTLFWMLTLLTYIRYTEKPSAGRFVLALSFFALGLLSKSMLVTLPLILLVLDYWPLNRLNSKTVIYEKIPFILLSVIFSVITFQVQWQIGLAKPLQSYPLGWRIENALVSYVIYIEKMFVPTNLAIFYPHPQGGIPLWQIIAAVSVLVFITCLALWQLKQRSYIAAGWLWFLITLIPVIGIIQVGLQAYADRYTYIPYIGLFIIIAWGVADLSARLPYRKVIISFTAVVVLLSLGVQSRLQASYWHDSIMLYQHAIAVTKDNWWAHRFLANALIEKGQTSEGIAQYKKSLKIDPQNATTQNELAMALLDIGDVNQAIEMYQKMLPPLPKDLDGLVGINPEIIKRNDIKVIIDLYTEANINLASAYLRRGDVNEAAIRLREVLRINPDSITAHRNLGDIFLQKGQIEDAQEQYMAVLRIQPAYLEEFKKFADTLLMDNKFEQAAGIYVMLIPFQPNDIGTYTQLGIAFAEQNKLDEAYACFNKVLSIRPGFADGYVNLANVFAIQGKLQQAIEQCDKALKLAPNHPKAIELKSQLLEQHRQPSNNGDTNRPASP